MPSTLSMLITRSAMMIVFTATQKFAVSSTSPCSPSGSSSLAPIHSNSRLPASWIHGSVISSAAHDVSAVISTTMPAVPTMNALRCCLGASDRHASAMTTALSPLSTILITAILASAVQVSGLESRASIARFLRTRLLRRGTSVMPRPYTRLSRALQQAYGHTGCWKQDAERVADAIDIVVEHDRRAVQRRDFADDREPQAAAV